MRRALIVLAAATVAMSQLPELNMLVVVDHGVVEQRPENGLYHYSTVSKELTRLWPPPGTDGGWGTAVKAAQYSPDMSQVAFYIQLDRLAIADRDGGNPQLIDLGRPFKVSDAAFAWTEQGIFWYDKDTYELLRYVPATGTVSTVCTLNYLPNTTSFGGVHASRDGSRLWSWLTLDHVSETDPNREESKPFIYINDNDYSNPQIRYTYTWGHANMMLPDGSKTLHIGWEFSNNTHPYIWIWNWDTFSADSTLTHGVDIDATRNHRLVQVANSNEWMGMMFKNDANYMWKFADAASGAQPILMDLNLPSYNMAHAWLGPYPNTQSTWHLSETQLLVSTDAPADTLHITNWPDPADPTVAVDKAWVGTPTVTRAGEDVTIVCSVASGPALSDTAMVTVTDAARTSKTCSVVWAPSQTPAERLAIAGVADVDAVTLSWSNTLGSEFTFGVQKSNGSGWGAMTVVDTQYVDTDPAEGDNIYRVAAIAAGDTSYQRVTIYYAAPASISILAPTEGNQAAAGEQVVVQWSAIKIESVQISVSENEGETWRLITQSAIDKGDSTWSNYTLVVPAAQSGSVMIRVHPYQQTTPYDIVTVSVVGSGVRTPRVSGGRARVAISPVFYDLTGRRLTGHHTRAAATPVVPQSGSVASSMVLPVRTRDGVALVH